MIKYEKEIDQLLKDLFKEDWMTEQEHEEVVSEVFKMYDISKLVLSEQIEVGVKNGYSLQEQIEIIKRLMKSN